VAIAYGSKAVATSPDGITWTSQTIPRVDNWSSVVYGYNRFVAVANGSSYAATSSDGIAWSTTMLPCGTSWVSIAYGDRTRAFVAVASGGTRAAYSTDGVNWTLKNLPSEASWLAVACGNGLFVAVACNGAYVATSADGKNWTQTTMPPAYSVTYDGNGSEGGSVPVDRTVYRAGNVVTVPDNVGKLKKMGFTFGGWNTAADGSGSTSYLAGDAFTMGSSNVRLYAWWLSNTVYTVTYNGNRNTGGSVPFDAGAYRIGQSVTVLGVTEHPERTGYLFNCWNTAADGSGQAYRPGEIVRMGSANIALYAQWKMIIPQDCVTDVADFGQIHFSEYYFSNTIWNKGNITNYSQYVYKPNNADFPLGWKLDWPNGARDSSVKAYPSIIFGWSPWDTAPTTNQLPKAVGQISDFNVTYDLVSTFDPNSRYNLAFDIWITREPGRTEPPDANITREIMIWLDYYPATQFPSIATITFDGVEYYYYRIEDFTNGDYTRELTIFARKTPLGSGALTGTVNIKSFFDYLRNQDFISDSEYVDMVALGNEIWFGSGTTVFNNYQVTVH
jgi:uncharacterized repeat protein (TIGR02543 family)